MADEKLEVPESVWRYTDYYKGTIHYHHKLLASSDYREIKEYILSDIVEKQKADSYVEGYNKAEKDIEDGRR